jgi:hypothetical protein
MSEINIAEIKRRANIRHVWAALGGPKLRGNRGQAFWRGGDGHSVSLDPNKDVWYDFVAAQGGDVVALVETVCECRFRAAIEWLADFDGVPKAGDNSTSFPRDHDTDWPTDLKWARWWKIIAETLADWALEELPPWHHQRRALTRLLSTIRLGDAALVNEYREWRRRDPLMTAGLAHAGRLHEARVQRRLARWIRRKYGPPTS